MHCSTTSRVLLEALKGSGGTNALLACGGEKCCLLSPLKVVECASCQGVVRRVEGTNDVHTACHQHSLITQENSGGE